VQRFDDARGKNLILCPLPSSVGFRNLINAGTAKILDQALPRAKDYLYAPQKQGCQVVMSKTRPHPPLKKVRNQKCQIQDK